MTDTEERAIAHGPVITYDVKDILADMRREQAAGFAELKGALSTKADKIDLAEIRGELKHHGERLDRLEDSNRGRDIVNQANVKDAKAREDKRTRRTTISLSMLGTAALVISVIEAFVVH